MDPFHNLSLFDPSSWNYAMTTREEMGQAEFQQRKSQVPQDGVINTPATMRHNHSLEPHGPTGGKLTSDELPEKKGICVSKPQTAGASRHSSDSSTSASTSSPTSSSTSVFEYRTAELPHANVNGICVGLSAEWLLNHNNPAPVRMMALMPGSERHTTATERQERYQNLKRLLRSEGAGAHEADRQAQNVMLREAGLAPSEEEKKYQFGEHSSFSRMVRKITQDHSTYLLGLYFAEGDAHTIVTSASNGTMTLFDPNYGEFSARSRNAASLMQSLANRYRNPNGKHLSIITTQRMQ
ncbi:Cysteine protease avirulence protein AvrPphB [Ensifer psoraleae]|uniref:YopT-type cysteine protease domain-containing protein n=1 Tax=Sinorhizobium psoraleae TaxID=520838 RepID=UPI001FE35BAD|nr:YopT-type cysteine protease domain-containing protein [Sinorhizobium psoraleae]NRP75786.1 Cysteine protease avirulence protein AvrPphB [Sinorhizobium psoraleae]